MDQINNKTIRQQKIQDIIGCPYCNSLLEQSISHTYCVKCNKKFSVIDGIPDFTGTHADEKGDYQFQSQLMFNSGITAKLYNLGKKFVSSEYMVKDQVFEFIEKADSKSIVLELGSGNRRLQDNVINIDLFRFPNVDIIADIAMLPIRNETVDFVILDTVLEHVPDPPKIVGEIHRILKPQGEVICITPFVFPYHGYPRHYYNFSKDGLEYIFRDFSEHKVEMNMGPTSALVNLIAEYFAVALSGENKFVYTLTKGLVLLPVFLLKYLDKLWTPDGRGAKIASHLCIRARK